MTGPEHYCEAEILAGQIRDGAVDWEPIAALGQMHATLAAAAATALNAIAMPSRDYEAWFRAAATRDPEAVP